MYHRKNHGGVDLALITLLLITYTLNTATITMYGHPVMPVKTYADT